MYCLAVLSKFINSEKALNTSYDNLFMYIQNITLR